MMPERRAIMLTNYSDDEALFESIMAGSTGYLLKQILGQDLVTAVRTVAAGGSLLDPSATTAVLERMRRAAEPSGPPPQLLEQNGPGPSPSSVSRSARCSSSSGRG